MALVIYNPKSEGYLFAAYRPIVFQTFLDYSPFGGTPAYPTIVYCDIYFNGVYYKSLSSTVYENVSITYFGFVTVNRPCWTFDIEDAAQEYLRSFPPALTGTTVVSDPAAIATFRCAFRSSSIDSNGFVQPETPIPVQGDFTTAPVSGGGVFSAYYLVANATLQHEDIQALETHLYDMLSTPPFSTFIYPLTHRDDNYISCKSQYDHIPVLIPWKGIDGDNSAQPFDISVDYVNDSGAFGDDLDSSFRPSIGGGMIYYIPSGLKNLAGMPFVDGVPFWGRVSKYRIRIISTQAPPLDGTVFTSNWINAEGCCCEDGARLHFMNGLGGYDSVNFCERVETLSTKSTAWQKSLPLIGMQKRDYGHQRFNVRSNEEVTVRTAAYPETALEWLKELLQSPRAYLEWTGIQGQANDLIPVKISDGKIVTRKSEGRYQYLLEVTYEMSNENIVQRG